VNVAKGKVKGPEKPDPDEPWTIHLRSKGNVKIVHRFPSDDDEIFSSEFTATSPLPKSTDKAPQRRTQSG
jgi:hypothetical protein